jgi:cell division protein FtsB
VEGRTEEPGSVRERLERLQAVVTELRAQTTVEATELRAEIRELERRIDELGGGGSLAAARARKRERRSKAKELQPPSD